MEKQANNAIMLDYLLSVNNLLTRANNIISLAKTFYVKNFTNSAEKYVKLGEDIASLKEKLDVLIEELSEKNK